MWSIEEELVNQGMERGIERGSELRLISMVCRKLKKGNSVEQIAKELEEELEVVERICEVAEQFSPEYDINQIYEAMQCQMV